ncbi:IucA/IucC family protein [Glycomyces buryatensis]|nr:IucA/IucC family protein [Glycomyces buryatensis]
MNLTAKTLAAAWRENLAGIRDTEQSFAFASNEGPFSQLDVTTAPDLTPVAVLEAILGAPAPEHLAAELASAETGLAIAGPRASARSRHLAALAQRTGASSLARLIAACTAASDRTARLLETLATEGHQLHPCARTRIGWDIPDFERFDLEATRPVHIRLIADTAGVLATSGADLRTHPMLAGLDLAAPVVPVHPWQLEHRILPTHQDLFTSGRLRLLEETIPAWPTAAIRTLAGHTAPGYLKLALGIHITSTRRDISPTTALLGPALATYLDRLHACGTETEHRILADTSGVWLPGSRDLTALARSSLADVTPAGAVCVPSTALAATSPVTGISLAAEYADWSGNADAWIRDYTALFTGPVLGKARLGIGLEAHLQNSLMAFRGPVPVRPITRDLGGARIHTPTVPFDLTLPPDSPVAARDMDQVRSKVAYTLFQNHLAALAGVLERDLGLDTAAYWADLADLIAGLDLPAADRDYYLADQVPTKALLTMRLHPGREIETTVDNPLAKGRP